jgi:receptor protein-tyrosine kinase
MSRIHDALRKAANARKSEPPPTPGGLAERRSRHVEPPDRAAASGLPDEAAPIVSGDSSEAVGSEAAVESTGLPSYAYTESAGDSPAALAEPGFLERDGNQHRRGALPAFRDTGPEIERLEQLIGQAKDHAFDPTAESLLINPAKPKEAPSEEFRSLRTRLNHLQNSQPLHTLVITSASPNEGKSFTACNLAISQAQISGKRILLADFDFRRPTIDKVFNIPSVPGITDYLLGRATLAEILIHITDSNLFLIPAGSPVQNPLELLNLSECAQLLEGLRDHFDWVILDSPPLLFAADANLLATMADGTILVVRIGNTTFDSVTRAVQSLCENNVLGIVVNGADRGELYSKYSYYHNYYYSPNDKPAPDREKVVEIEPVGVGEPH